MRCDACLSADFYLGQQNYVHPEFCTPAASYRVRRIRCGCICTQAHQAIKRLRDYHIAPEKIQSSSTNFDSTGFGFGSASGSGSGSGPGSVSVSGSGSLIELGSAPIDHQMVVYKTKTYRGLGRLFWRKFRSKTNQL